MKYFIGVLFPVVFMSAWWSSPENLGIAGYHDMYPQSYRRQNIFLPRGCIVWQCNINGNWDIFSRFGTGHIWSDTVRVTSAINDDQYPSVTFDVIRDCFWSAWHRSEAGYTFIYVSYGDMTSG